MIIEGCLIPLETAYTNGEVGAKMAYLAHQGCINIDGFVVSSISAEEAEVPFKYDLRAFHWAVVGRL